MPKKASIIGIARQAGPYRAERLLVKGYKDHGVSRLVVDAGRQVLKDDQEGWVDLAEGAARERRF